MNNIVEYILLFKPESNMLHLFRAYSNIPTQNVASFLFLCQTLIIEIERYDIFRVFFFVSSVLKVDSNISIRTIEIPRKNTSTRTTEIHTNTGNKMNAIHKFL